jgi:choline dehydrogenase
VGENLRDHYLARLAHTTRIPGLTFTAKARGLGLAGQILRYALRGDGLLASTVVPLRMYVRLRDGLAGPDCGISVTPFLFEAAGDDLRVARQEGFTVTVHPLRPLSTGSVHLASPDPRAAPAIRFNYLSAPEDQLATVAGIRKVRELMAAPPIAQVTAAETAPGPALQSDAELLDWARRTSDSGYHPVGTCQMGPGPQAVVNHRLKVHGIAGLRVADAAIMPMITSGNTNAPAILIGEKCADLVLAGA